MVIASARGSRTLVVALAVSAGVASATVAEDNQGHAAGVPHVHVAVPPEYAAAKAPAGIWSDSRALARGRAIYLEKCVVCHGREGRGDGPAAASLPTRPASFQDPRMVGEMSGTYWFWRVSEGGAIEPYKSQGSTMPAWKSELSPDDRWAVIAYQHSLSGHTGPHTAAEHPEMDGTRPHPAPRGINFGSEWVTRDHRWQPRGPWKWAVMRDLPQLYREFNGIDFGHASSPSIPPDEEQVAPTFNRLAWEVAKTFDWAHIFHRSLYDLFASDKVQDKATAYRKLLADYLEKPEAITTHRLDHHGALWSFPESKAFRDKFPKFNTQIWAYHWLQAAVYDVQLLGDVRTQQALMPKVIVFYHGYLRRPPVEWRFMPMMPEAAPTFSKRYSEAAVIFDNLHMLHDNFDDILSRSDLFPTLEAKRTAILKILPIYLNRAHTPKDLYTDFEEQPAMQMGGAMSVGQGGMAMDIGPRPPSVHEVLAGTAPPSDQPQSDRAPDADHKHGEACP